MKVRVVVSGDCIINRQPYGWEIIAITDTNHAANLWINGRNPLNQDMRLAGKLRTVTFEPNEAVELTTDPGRLWDKLLNISGSRFHGVDATSRKSNIKGEWRKTGRNDIVRMVIPIGLAQVVTDVPDYWFCTANPLGQLQFVGHPVATSVSITFNLKPGDGVNLRIMDDGGSASHHIPFTDGTTVDAFFSNDCGGGSHSVTDFLRYYEWMRDQRTSGENELQFIAGKHNGYSAPAALFERLLAKLGSGDAKLSDEEMQMFKGAFNPMGNCDPVGSDPPLWP